MNDISDNSRFSTEGRLPDGKFGPGNPGRPKGSKNRISNTAMRAVKSMSDDAIQQLQNKLEKGDWQAITFVLERILPRGRTVELDGIEPTDIMREMLEGSITTVEAKEIAVALKNLNEIGELSEIKKKIDFLEDILTQK